VDRLGPLRWRKQVARAIPLKKSASRTSASADELIRASTRASNSMMTVEEASREDLDRIQNEFRDQSGA
jgi:low affinity Fe/Cu permease